MQTDEDLSLSSRLRLAAMFACGDKIELSTTRHGALKLANDLEARDLKAEAVLRAIAARNAMELIERHEIRMPLVVGYVVGVLTQDGLTSLLHYVVAWCAS